MLLKHFLKPYPVSESFSMRCSNDMTHTSSNYGMSIKVQGRSIITRQGNLTGRDLYRSEILSDHLTPLLLSM